MAAAITYSTNIINYSITNPDISTFVAKDNSKPFTFLEFTTNTNVDYSPDEYNKFYLSYLQEWANVKNSQSVTENENFVQYYIDFLKEIVVTYATTQERLFLSKIDFTDPVDLDIAIPFFTEKIRQVILFYKSKRDDAKYTIDRNKIKGTDISVEKGLYDNIYNYVFSSQDEPVYASLGASLSSISQNLKIDLEEYVDVYGNYFDIPEDVTEFYTYNTTNIDPNLYFGDAFKQIFNNQAFIVEIPLIANVALSFNNFCDPENPLALIQSDKTTGLTKDNVTALQRQFLSKYVGTDIYYIDNTTGVPVSGVLIKADNPANNPNNIQKVYTPTLISSRRKMLRSVGLFFAPDNQGLFQLNTSNFSYSIDYNNLKKDKIYFFPDPNKFGNVTKDGTSDYPLIFVYDYRPDAKNTSSGYAIGTPNVRNNEQTFSPYYATEQSKHNSVIDLDLNFSSLYNEGYIKKLQYDIYGNEYALFKDRFGHSFKRPQRVANQLVKNLLLDGHVFYDAVESYFFNYDTESKDGTTIRSGLSTHTVVYEGSPSFNLSGNFAVEMFFRSFIPYTELFQFRQEGTKRKYAVRDGYTLTYDNGTLLSDPVPTSSPSWPTAGNYYYNTLADGGLSGLYPVTRALSGGDLTLDVKFVLSANNVEVYDCGNFNDTYELENDYIYNDNIPYIDTVPDYALTVASNLTGSNTYKAQIVKDQLQGKIFVKNGSTNNILPLSTILYGTFNKYTSAVKTEVYNNPIDLEIFYNTICVETPSFLVFDKISFDDGRFTTSTTKNTIFSINSASSLNNFSNRFFNEKQRTVTFCAVSPFIVGPSGSLITINTPGSAAVVYNSVNKTIMPTIYQYNIVDNSFRRLFPSLNQIQQLSGVFTPSSTFDNECAVNLVHIKKPVLTYNSLNDIYKFTYLALDNSNMFHLFDYAFTINSDRTVKLLDSKYYKHDKVVRTTDFTNYLFANINVNDTIISLSSSYVTGTELII